MLCKSFDPIIAPNAKVLILGTMPSVTSLEKHQYYGNPRNHFWTIIYSVLELPLPLSYAQRVQGLMNNRIALWDVLSLCNREGSADSAITAEIPNDFSDFFDSFPEIRLLCFNGTKARDLWKKHVGPITNGKFDFVTLPSSSPTPGRNVRSLDQKIEAWMVIRDYLG